MIYAESLTKIYRLPAEEIHALKAIDLFVREGEFVAIMGPSGAGKTTFLNLAGALDNRTSGVLRVGNVDWDGSESAMVKLRREWVGFVFQEFFLLPQLTALENVTLPHLFTKKTDRAFAEKLLHKVGLGSRVHHRPTELSGGEMQRVAIARALANRPRVLLADEPTGNLDTRNSLNIFQLFRTLAVEQGITVVVATHNAKLAQMADRIIHLQDGRILGETKGRSGGVVESGNGGVIARQSDGDGGMRMAENS